MIQCTTAWRLLPAAQTLRAGVLGVAVLSVTSLGLTGCSTVQPGFDALKAQVRAVNQALLNRLQGLERSGLEISQEGEQIRIVVPDVFFDFGRSDLSPDARDVIGKVAGMLEEADYAAHQISIQGHSDSVGSEQYNLKLSRARAESVEKELVFSDLDSARITDVVGIGEARPVAPNTRADGSDDPEGRARNRRVEILLTDPRLASR